jgi:hypothetical protein
MTEPHVIKASAKYNSEWQQWHLICRFSNGEEFQAAAISEHGGDIAHYLAVALPGRGEVPPADHLMKTGLKVGDADDFVYEVAPPEGESVYVTVVGGKPELAGRIGGLLVIAVDAGSVDARPSG